MRKDTAEHRRLDQHRRRQADWRRWGPYISERAWGTVREDYSDSAEPWSYFPHDHARSRAYRWNEDGLGGICNRFQNTCLAVALWNGRDPILKERLFGVTGPEGNHGEDVKEYYFYLDALPSNAYMAMLYKYPQVPFPYRDLVEENRRRTAEDPEYELFDALRGPLEEGRYFDVLVEWAKRSPDDLHSRITVTNAGPEAAPIWVLPHVWHRNSWSWKPAADKPEITATSEGVRVFHHRLGERWWYAEGADRLLFTENETNVERLLGAPNRTPYTKDAFDDVVVHGREDRVNPALTGTKAASVHHRVVPPRGRFTVRVRFPPQPIADPFELFDTVVEERRREADAFYDAIHPTELTQDQRRIQRQAFAGLIWSQQFYHYNVARWLEGDPLQPAPPASRRGGRNRDWQHVYSNDVLSMPDKWEYPWFAACDLAFHAVPLALADPHLAKRQIILLLREWYMHPNGALPAYEWSFSDVNPPVHAWGAWQVYKITREVTGEADTDFLEQALHKLLLNFTWWVNKKDRHGHNLFQGGFLGLDNIGVFDRSSSLPTGGHLEQADGTAWMAMYCLNMLGIAVELARTRPAYEDIATKFFEHFVFITDAIFGGNSNWRGPIWFPINYLMIQALRKYHLNYGDSLKVDVDGRAMTLEDAADELTRRLISIFEVQDGRRPVFSSAHFSTSPRWRNLIPFYEYFHGDEGHGLGASHQTGWTALVAKLLHGPDEIGMQ